MSIDEETNKYEIIDNKDEKKPENTLSVDKSKEEKKKEESKANNGEAGKAYQIVLNRNIKEFSGIDGNFIFQ